MSAPTYRVLVSYDAERKVYSAHAPELDHCTGEGQTRAEAIAKVEEEIQAQVANVLASGGHAPTPVDEETFSGEIATKVSARLHRDLAWQARVEGIEMGQLLTELLASALEHRRGARPQRGGNQRPQHQQVDHDNIGNSAHHGGGQRGGRNFGGRYNQGLLEDRANFIEYVRNLEHNGGHAGHGGGQGFAGRGGGGGGGGRRRGRGRGPGGPGPMGNGNPGNGGPNGNGRP